MNTRVRANLSEKTDNLLRTSLSSNIVYYIQKIDLKGRSFFRLENVGFVHKGIVVQECTVLLYGLLALERHVFVSFAAVDAN